MIYVYTTEDFINASQVNIEDIQNIIKDSAISSANVLYINGIDEDGIIVVEINFDGNLSSSDQDILNNIISNYTYRAYADNFAAIKDIRPPGTNGGTFTKGTWHKRQVNTLEGDVNFVSITNSQITLQPGTYSILVKAPACDVRNHQCRLKNITDDIDILGTSAFSYNGIMTNSDIYTVLTIDAVKVFEIHHICSDTALNVGFGKATGFNAVELFTVMTVQRTV